MTLQHISTRLILVFGLLFIVNAAGVGLLIYKLDEIQRNTDQLLKQDFALYQSVEATTLGIVQVQQWLTDISATRGLDGLNDGFEQAEVFATVVRTENAKMQQLLPNKREQLESLLKGFESYYLAGQTMAQRYIDDGAAGGNKTMAAFDKASEALQKEFQPLQESIYNDLSQHFADESQLVSSLTIQSIVISVLVLAIFLLSGIIIRTMLVRIAGINESMAKMASGNADFNHRLEVHNDDEISAIAETFNTILGKLGLMVDQVIDIAGNLSKSSQQAQSLTAETSSSLSTQATSVSNLSDSITHMSTLSQNVNSSIDGITKQVQAVADRSNSGSKVIESAVSKMQELVGEVTSVNNIVNELNQQSSSIGNVVTIIANIAEQTNLLALNAAIEAARAGEHGRGFAVVADEVRNLSASTTQATQDIQGLIDTIQQSSAVAVKQVDLSSAVAAETLEKSHAAGEAFADITESVNEIYAHANEVSSVTGEQLAVSDKINLDINHINAEVQTLAQNAQRDISENGDLSQYSMLLESTVSSLTSSKAPTQATNEELF